MLRFATAALAVALALTACSGGEPQYERFEWTDDQRAEAIVACWIGQERLGSFRTLSEEGCVEYISKFAILQCDPNEVIRYLDYRGTTNFPTVSCLEGDGS